MEKNDISAHEVRVFKSLTNEWKSTREISEEAQVAYRTANMHLLRFVKLGLIDLARVFPGHRYRLSEKSNKRNAGYHIRLDQAASALGL